MDKRVYSALSAGLLLNQVKLNINRDIFTLNKGNNYYLYDDISYNITNRRCKPYETYSEYYFRGIIFLSFIKNTIMLNMNIAGESFNLLMGNQVYNDFFSKNMLKKKQFIFNEYYFKKKKNCIYVYNKNIPLLKLVVKMHNDYRLQSKVYLQLEITQKCRSVQKEKKFIHMMYFKEPDECQNNRSKYCLLSALQRLAVYKSLYYILPDVFLLDRAFKMFCKRQHGINHNSFLKAHKNY